MNGRIILRVVLYWYDTGIQINEFNNLLATNKTKRTLKKAVKVVFDEKVMNNYIEYIQQIFSFQCSGTLSLMRSTFSKQCRETFYCFFFSNKYRSRLNHLPGCHGIKQLVLSSSVWPRVWAGVGQCLLFSSSRILYEFG